MGRVGTRVAAIGILTVDAMPFETGGQELWRAKTCSQRSSGQRMLLRVRALVLKEPQFESTMLQFADPSAHNGTPKRHNRDSPERLKPR
jgi:hypothetical protein